MFKRKPIKKILILLCAVFFCCDSIFAGTFKGLEPGTSTKREVDKILGIPEKEVMKNISYNYTPENNDTRRIFITFYRNKKVVETINIYPKKTYSKAKYQEWLDLKKPEKTKIDDNGNFVEYYISNGIALHFDGSDNSSAVRFFSHFDPAAFTRKKAPKRVERQKNEDYYIMESDKAAEKMDWIRTKALIEEGISKYPNSGELWQSRALYYFKSKSEPKEIRRIEIQRSMEKAYKLKPSPKHAADMGWVYRMLHNDCYTALSYFEEAEKKGYSREKPALFYWMGRCYEMIGEYRAARAYYGRFLDMAPKDKNSSDARARLSKLP